MQKHSKIYFNHYGYGEQDYIICEVENCFSQANSIHHIKKRSQGGTNDIFNLIALCAEHHHKTEHNKEFNQILKDKKDAEFNRKTTS